MDKYAKLAAMLKSIVSDNNAMPILIPGRVQQVFREDEVCSVRVGELLLPGVRLKAVISGDEDKLLVMPAEGSYVLLASLSGDLRDLAIVKVDQVKEILYQQDGMHISIDSQAMSYKNDELEFIIDANDKKVSVQNNSTSLFDLFSQLTSLLKTLKVYTPSGPSGTPLPDSVIAIEKFENDFKQLLK